MIILKAVSAESNITFPASVDASWLASLTNVSLLRFDDIMANIIILDWISVLLSMNSGQHFYPLGLTMLYHQHLHTRPNEIKEGYLFSVLLAEHASNFPVHTPGLHHLDIQEPVIKAPVPFFGSCVNGIPGHQAIYEIHSAHVGIIHLQQVRLIYFDFQFCIPRVSGKRITVI